MTDMTEQELQREVEAQALADRVWEIISQRVHSQLEGVIALEPEILHPHIDLWFSHRTNNDPSKVANNTLLDVMSDSLSGHWRMHAWFKSMFKNQMQDITYKL
jgi:hypothetical protein